MPSGVICPFGAPFCFLGSSACQGSTGSDSVFASGVNIGSGTKQGATPAMAGWGLLTLSLDLIQCVLGCNAV